jgi:integrase
MAGKQAKILSEDDLQDLLFYAAATRDPIRNRVIVLLSAKAGLRAGEVAKLTWDMVVEPNGAIGTVIELRDHAAKKRSGRIIPLHADLRDALLSWRSMWRGRPSGVVGTRPCHDPPERRHLVREGLSRHRPSGVLVPFRAPHVHHSRGAAGP